MKKAFAIIGGISALLTVGVVIAISCTHTIKPSKYISA